MSNLGARIYGLAVLVTGIACLLWGDFAVDWIPPPANLAGRTEIAYLVGVLLIVGGLLMTVPRTTAWGAALVTVTFAVGYLLLDVTFLARHLKAFDAWDANAEQLALISAGAIAFAMSAKIGPEFSARLQLVARIVFGLCLLSFGAAHFVFATFTASLVPKWLPPNGMFWAYATGAAQIAAGLAVLSGIQALLAARLLTAMYVLFGLLVWVPILVAAPAKHGNWSEGMVTVALIGSALIVADSLAARSSLKK